MEYLRLIAESENSAFLEVKTAKEAGLLLNGIASFAERRKSLINSAAEIFIFCEKTQKLNEFVRNNVFLGNENLRPEYPEMYHAAKEYLENAPQFSKYYTQETIKCIWQSILTNLPKEEIVKLLEEIQPNIEMLTELEISGTQKYQNNLLFIREKLGVPYPNTETIDTKLKGVTLENNDKSSRQEYLKQLKAAYKKSPQELTVECWEYEGAPAAKVFWGEKEIGAIPAELMKELSEKHSYYELTAEIVKVSGGDDFNYGCDIKLHVFGEQKSNLKIADFFNRKQAEEVKESENKETPKEDEKDDNGVEELDFE